MAYLLSYPPPLLPPRVLHWHLGVDGEAAAIPVPQSCPLLLNQLIINIKTIAGGTEEGADATAYAFSGYLLPVAFIIKAG